MKGQLNKVFYSKIFITKVAKIINFIRKLEKYYKLYHKEATNRLNKDQVDTVNDILV